MFPKPNHCRRIPKRVDRTKFDNKTRKKIFQRDDGKCRSCGSPGTQIHHVKPRGSGQGKGIFTNGVLLCNRCHRRCHEDPEILRAWQHTFELEYGKDYFRDKYDLLGVD